MIPKFRKWLTINYGGGFTLAFYIFNGEKLHDNYIQNYKPYNYMSMQKKAWMTSSLFKRIPLIPKRLVQGGRDVSI
jgi:hypothetical protein